MVVVLSKVLIQEPQHVTFEGLGVRTFQGDHDIDTWLKVREKSFANAAPPIRSWNPDDFRREIKNRHWWQPERTWFAEMDEGLGHQQVVGTVTLSMRRPEQPVVHWLAVLPTARRRGAGRLLMVQLERECWRLGHRRIVLESETGWTEAAAFYEQMGYEQIA